MEEAEKQFGDHSSFLFEKAQYHARGCEYQRALEYYEKSWELDEKPRFTDALQAIAIIHEILGNTSKAIETYDRMIACIKDEWGYTDEDAAVTEVEREKKRLVNG